MELGWYLIRISVYGPAVIEHMLLKVGLPPSTKVKSFNVENIPKIVEALGIAEAIINDAFSSNHKVTYDFKLENIYERLNSNFE